MSKQQDYLREYIKEGFDGVHRRIEELEKSAQERHVKAQNALNGNTARIVLLEKDVNGAKLIGKVALGVSVALGGMVTWATNILAKLPAIKGGMN